jgi:hypothetical protein
VANLSFALDENVADSVASILRLRGLDADSARELGRLRLSDVQVLLRATEARQTLVTHNRGDFRALHEAWVTWRRRWGGEVERIFSRRLELSQHAGILIVPVLPNYDLARLLEEFADTAGSMNDRLFAWNQARGWHELHFYQPTQ